MRRVPFSENHERLFVARLLDKAVACEVATGWVPGDEVLFGEEGLSASVVARSKVDLGEPKSVLVVVWRCDIDDCVRA